MGEPVFSDSMIYLVMTNVSFVRSSDGRVRTDPLWAKDLIEHCHFVDHLNIVAPLELGLIPADWPEIPQELNVTFIPLPLGKGLIACLLQWRRIARGLDAKIAEADVVQIGVAGWPIPAGWYARKLALRHGKLLVTVVESAPWRSTFDLKSKTRAWMYEAMARRCIASSDLAVFTHQGYRQTMCPEHPRGKTRLVVIPASWIDADKIVTPAELGQRLQQRAATAPLRVLFAARLVEEKGTETVLELARRLQADGGISISVIGQGYALPKFEALQREANGVLRVLPPVPYGPEFFALVDAHDVALAPTISDEQPRVIFDAFARGVPMIASNTTGNSEVVTDGVNGWLFPRGDAGAVEAILKTIAADRAALLEFGKNAIVTARRSTHWEMHRVRMDHVRQIARSRAPARGISDA